MSERPGNSLDVPVRPIRPPGGRDLRAWLVGFAALAIVGTAGAFTVLSRPVSRETAALPTATTLPSSPAGSDPVGSPSATLRIEQLPDIANVPMPGAPWPVFFRRAGDDVEILAWEPGTPGLRPVRTIPEAFAQMADGPVLIGVLSPDKRSIFARGFDSSTSGQPDRGRLTSLDGPEWTTNRLTSTFGVAWAADSRSLAVSSGAATWLLVEFGDGEPAEREVVIDPALEPIRPRQPGLEPPELTPAGFSADGRWIYGLNSRGDGTFVPAVRVSTADGSVETLSAFPIEGPEAIVPSDTMPSTLDPATGQSIDPRSLGFLPQRPGHLDIHEADGSPAWSLEVDTVLSAAWIGGGRLVIAEAAGYPNPTGTQVLIVERDGFRRTPLITSGPVTGMAVASLFEAHALVGVVVERPEQAVLVCVLRLSDGTVSAFKLSEPELAGLQLGGWLPAN